MTSMRVVVSCLCLCALTAHPLTATDQPQVGDHLNQFLVRVDKRDLLAVARDHGFVVAEKQPLENIGFYSLIHPEIATRSKRSADQHKTKLLDDPRVGEISQLKVLDRVKREIIYDKQLEFPVRKINDPSVFYRVHPSKLTVRGMVDRDCRMNTRRTIQLNDPFFGDSWYLDNRGQTGGKCGMDMHPYKAWQSDFTGRGISVVVLDDGLDRTHPDLRDNYDPSISYDVNDDDDDPTPDKRNPDNSHGTRCSGEIAGAANNHVCSVGIAYNCRIGGVRMLDGVVTDLLEAQAMNFRVVHVHIYSASWGPRDDGATMEAPSAAAQAALAIGVQKGRDGKGSLYVWATGNGGIYSDCCAADGYVSSRFTISIGSINEFGRRPCFMEKCSSTMGVVPSGGDTCDDTSYHSGPRIRVVTTDINGGCIENFEGTSSAAPLAAGALAIVLEANPDLGWRDVLHIMALTSYIPIVDKDLWVNDSGFHYDNAFGFGVLDVSTMVSVAVGWGNVPPEHECRSPVYPIEEHIPSNQCVHYVISMNECQSDAKRRMNYLEHVLFHVNLDHTRRGDIEIYVTAPTTTMSHVLYRRSNDKSADGINFPFMTLNFWGESPAGDWKFSVCDNDGGSNSNNSGTVHSINVTWFGMYLDKKPRSTYQSYKPTTSQQLAIIRKEKEAYQRETIIKRSDVLNNRKHRNLKESVQKDQITASELSTLINEIEHEIEKRKFGKVTGDSSRDNTNARKRHYKDEHINVLRKYFGDHVEQSENEEIEDMLDEIEELFERHDRRKRQANVENHLFSRRWLDRPEVEFIDLLEEVYLNKANN